MNGQTVIETHELTKVYATQVAVDHLNLKVEQGEIFGFLGPNGAGKTTTIIMLLGLSEPTSGQARICGLDPAREPLKVKRIVGYLPENVGFYDDLNAVQNLRFISRLNGIPDAVAAGKIEELLKLVDLQKGGRLFARDAAAPGNRRRAHQGPSDRFPRRTDHGVGPRRHPKDVGADPISEPGEKDHGFYVLPSPGPGPGRRPKPRWNTGRCRLVPKRAG